MLSPEQITARRGKLTASRIKHLMRGDAQEIYRLWLELTDSPDFVPEDLSGNLPVRMGETTEQLNLEWYERKGTRVSRRGEVVRHPHLEWAAATLDGWDDDLHCPVECKHVGGREPTEVVVERYQPQMQYQMEITQSKICALSMFIGTATHTIEYIDRDDGYIAEMIKRGQQFMTCVENRIVPVVLPPVAAPIIAEAIYDMSGFPTWQAAADQWIQTFGAAQSAKDAERILKNLVPEDAKKAHGCGVRITRDRVGRLSLREETE